MTSDFSPIQAIFLRRQSILFADAGERTQPDMFMEALEVNFADLGYAISSRLRARLQTLSPGELTALQSKVWEVLSEKVGCGRTHTPLFRRFPNDIPCNTSELWLRRVLSHFMQGECQPCLHCLQTGTTHVLNPCRHVVCDSCYDGSNYSACPICGQSANRASAFFKPAVPALRPSEKVTFKLLDLGTDMDLAARDLFGSMCQRRQAMSPTDVADFLALIREYGLRVISWLPEEVSVRENIALVFGTLLQREDPAIVMTAASRYIGTATDALRLIAAYSGVDPALQSQTVYRKLKMSNVSGFARVKLLIAQHQHYWSRQTTIDLPVQVRRFKVAKLGRPLRRALLAFLEALHPDALVEDMLRHRSYWVWLGEFLHPAEYKKRYPKVASAFEIIRQRAPDGTAAPVFQTYYARLETAAVRRDAREMTRLLLQRPGELARRYDHALRIAADDQTAIGELFAAFSKSVPRFSTPVLLTLNALLPTRVAPAPARIYWPKGKVSESVFASDTRAPLPVDIVCSSIELIEIELLSRFADKPHFNDFVIDEALRDVIAPFNERTASRAAVQLPRGSSLPFNLGKTARFFLHWCEPEKDGSRTDLDLSVGFYDERWKLKGTCSYYELDFSLPGAGCIAKSAGDLTSAPYPDGATEFIDLDCVRARQVGIRYAVAVLNNYSGMRFEQLEHAFAGVMLRDDVTGEHFDPRTVELKFDLQGGNGIFMPMVIDLAESRLHWLDVYSRGAFEFNNLASSNRAITAICPTMIDYFARGVRTSMYELALLHAAARGERVTLRGENTLTIARNQGEDNLSFLKRLRSSRENGVVNGDGWADAPLLALLARGDLVVPEGSTVYALMPGVTAGNLAASDLIS